MSSEAEELNEKIRESFVYSLLSDLGKKIYFPRTSILIQAAEAKGKKLNATIGIALQDDKTPMRLASIEKKILLNPKDVFPYASNYGKPELRALWLEKIRKENKLKETSTPIVAGGLTNALSMVAYLFVNPGDRIVTTDKFWENYEMVFGLPGGILDTFNMFKGGGLDLESFRKKLKEGKGKKIVLFNFPHNPTGYSPTEKEVREIVEIIEKEAEKNKILVILDDAYFGLVYKKGAYRGSLFSKLAGLENVFVIKVDGPTKEDYSWGLRVAFITYAGKGIKQETYKALEEKTAGLIRGTISNASHPSQSLVLEASKSKTYQKEKEENYRVLKKRFEKVQEVLKDKKYADVFKPLPCNSGYFICLEPKVDTEKVRKLLLQKYDTGVVVFENLIRVAFCSLSEGEVKKVFENIYQACKSELSFEKEISEPPKKTDTSK